MCQNTVSDICAPQLVVIMCSGHVVHSCMALEVRDQGSCAGGAVKGGHSVQNQHNVFGWQRMSSAGG